MPYSKLKNMLKLILKTVLDILLPLKCIECKTKGDVLYEQCIFKITHSTSTHKKIISLFNYKDTIVKKALWTFKYNNNKPMAKIFAQAMNDRIIEELSDQELFSNFCKPLLIPIPLSKKRFKERGFNQSELIAQELSLLDLDKSFTLQSNVLYKTRDTVSQVSIKDKNERLSNLHGCFSVANPEIVKDKNIILIDDVTTTGATISEARKTLLAAGAKKIIAFTVAH